MGNTLYESFSYHIKRASIITQAKDIAKEQGKTFSQYIVDLVEADTIKYNESEKLQQSNVNVNCSSISILNNGQDQQSLITADGFEPHLYRNNIEKKLLKVWIDTTKNEKLRYLSFEMKDARKWIKDRKDREYREANEKARFKRKNAPISLPVRLDSMKLNLNPFKLVGDDNEDIPEATDDGYASR